MRSLFLILPLLLVIAMAGYVQGESSSEMDSVIHPSQIDQQKAQLSLLRNIREPARNEGRNNNNKPEKKKKKKVVRKNKFKGRKNKKGGGKKKDKGGKRKKTKKGRKKKKNVRSGKKKGGNKKKPGKKLPPKKRNGGKRKNQNLKQATCTRSSVSETCLTNALEVMNFEKNQVSNYLKQKSRLENQNKLTGNKKGKKGNFYESSDFMLKAIGGDASKPICGENNTASRSSKAALDNYNTLISCNVSIGEACDMPNDTIDADKLKSCFTMYTKVKKDSEACREDDANENDGALACACWEKIFVYIEETVKPEKCAKFGSDTAKAVKKQKNTCIDAFRKCKKAQDTAVELIHACMSGEVNTNATDTGNKVLNTDRVLLS